MQVVPTKSLLQTAGENIDAVVPGHSLVSFDLLKETSSIRIAGTDSLSRSSI